MPLILRAICMEKVVVVTTFTYQMLSQFLGLLGVLNKNA